MLPVDLFPLEGETVHQLADDFAVQVTFDSITKSSEPPSLVKSMFVFFKVINGSLFSTVGFSISFIGSLLSLQVISSIQSANRNRMFRFIIREFMQ